MARFGLAKFERLLTLLVVVLILKVTASVVWGYRDYFPPNFRADFLTGRQAYFFGPYRWAFYTHVAVGPLTLLLGMLLISDRFRQRFPRWHRTLGKTQIMLVLLLLAPSGLWMAFYSDAGAVGVSGFATLAMVTGACALLGWRSAVGRRFAEHRRWMSRCFLLLCSAVVIRLIGGWLILTDNVSPWSYPLSAWGSWLLPLAVYELVGLAGRRREQLRTSQSRQFAGSHAASSLPAIEISARR